MASAKTMFTGDTSRVVATFRDYAVPPDVGDLQDPDDEEALVKVYDADETIIDSGTGTKQSEGVYFYDYTAPDQEGSVYFEFKGFFSGLPQLARAKISVKFKPV